MHAYDADQAGGTHFLVMEFVEGIDLAKLVEKTGPAAGGAACDYIRQAALGLEHAHEQGMVHRDIKPHNLMLAPAATRRRGTVKVIDFGLARFVSETASDSAVTGENALMGTPDYIAPEQAQDPRKADIRADIYSLGCTLFHLLMGRSPLAGSNLTQKLTASLTGKLPLSDLPASVPAELRMVLAKMVAKDPAGAIRLRPRWRRRWHRSSRSRPGPSRGRYRPSHRQRAGKAIGPGPPSRAPRRSTPWATRFSIC